MTALYRIEEENRPTPEPWTSQCQVDGLKLPEDDEMSVVEDQMEKNMEMEWILLIDIWVGP